ILFRRGDEFDTTKALYINQPHVLVGAYGDAAKAKPIIKWVGTRSSGTIIPIMYPAVNITVQDLTIDTAFNADTNGSGVPFGIQPSANDTTVRRCTFLNVGYGVNANTNLRGLLVQDSSAPDRKALRGYFLWMTGTDFVVLGDTVA